MKVGWCVVIPHKQQIKHLLNSANMGECIKDKFNDDKRWGSDLLLARCRRGMGTDNHTLLEDWIQIRIIKSLELIISFSHTQG